MIGFLFLNESKMSWTCFNEYHLLQPPNKVLWEKIRKLKRSQVKMLSFIKRSLSTKIYQSHIMIYLYRDVFLTFALSLILQITSGAWGKFRMVIGHEMKNFSHL